MRSWYPIAASELDDAALLAEHSELHTMARALLDPSRGYGRHPETLRWEGRGAAMEARHAELVAEMLRRGFHHRTPWIGPEGGSSEGPPPREPLQDLELRLLLKKAMRAVADRG
jgi:hypothetical protein